MEGWKYPTSFQVWLNLPECYASSANINLIGTYSPPVHSQHASQPFQQTPVTYLVNVILNTHQKKGNYKLGMVLWCLWHHLVCGACWTSSSLTLHSHLCYQCFLVSRMLYSRISLSQTSWETSWPGLTDWFSFFSFCTFSIRNWKISHFSKVRSLVPRLVC